MGHDISAYNSSNEEAEVAYLRRSAFNPLNNEIYKALEAMDCYGGVSGNGTEKLFTKEQLLKALEYLNNKNDLEPEMEFINDCLNSLNENNNILINFG